MDRLPPPTLDWSLSSSCAESWWEYQNSVGHCPEA
jgi:hypothetical protein